MTKTVILDQKLIVPNDYLQFWVHFEWFLSLFQILDKKTAIFTDRDESTFMSQILFLKIFRTVFWSPIPSYAKNRVKLVPK